MSEYLGCGLALRAAEAEINSARPGSPVVPERHRRPSATRARAGVAASLQWLARLVEPAERRTFACDGSPQRG